MRQRWLLLLPGLCACEPPRAAVVYPQYQPSVASESWCRLGEGVYALVPRPHVTPSLVSSGCTAPRREPLPVMARPGSTFAELVVEPGASIEIPVQLPKALQGVGCQLDSVLIPHGKRTSDVALEIASDGRVLPIVSYEQLPPPREADVAQRTVSDESTQRAIWAPDAPPGENSLAAIADPELWPTGAVLTFDGGRTADGAASVVFEVEREPGPESAEEPATQPTSPADPPSPMDTPPPAGAPSPGAPSPGAPPMNTPPADPPPPADTLPPDTQASPPPAQESDAPAAPPVRQPPPLELIAYRHPIDITAPDAFSIVLRAREKPFGIGVRSARESPDLRLSYRAPGASELVPAHLVPQVAIVVSRCGRPVDEVLRDIR